MVPCLARNSSVNHAGSSEAVGLARGGVAGLYRGIVLHATVAVVSQAELS